jgi:glycosyltransferase involved in cell wall biosynthesis
VVLGFVGRLVTDKGLTELRTAWLRLRERHPHLHLLLAGAGGEPRGGVANDELQAWRADPRVHVLGVVEDIERIYTAMDVLAFPSHREGFSNAVLEAAAMGLPVVGFDVVGVRDGIRHGETGLLCPALDAQAFGDALESLIVDPTRRQALGAAARAWTLRDFRPHDRLQFVEDLYRSLLPSPPP